MLDFAPPMAVAGILGLIGLVLALSFRAFLTLAIWPRSAVLIAITIVLFALPWLCPHEALPARGVITLICCAVLPTKLLDAHLNAEWWRKRSLLQWVILLLHPFIISPRWHAGAPRVPLPKALLQSARGALEIAAGALFMSWVFAPEREWTSFWLEHAGKLGALYLLIDGTFVLTNGFLRIGGARVLDFGRHPIAALTPADFWRRYNMEAGRFLREDLYYPFRHRGMNRRAAIIVVFLINGVLHEYLATLMIGHILGYQVVYFALHGIAVAFTFDLRPRGWSAVVSISLTIAFGFLTVFLFFASADAFLEWYTTDHLLQ